MELCVVDRLMGWRSYSLLRTNRMQMSGPQQITVGVNCFAKMSAHICLLNSSLRGWLNLVMSTEACDTLGPESKDVRGLSQVSVNT